MGHFLLKFNAKHFYKPNAIHHLLEQIPMLLPFKDNEHKLGLLHVVQLVANHLTTLYTLLSETKGQDGFTTPASDLAERKGIGYPHTFGRAVEQANLLGPT